MAQRFNTTQVKPVTLVMPQPRPQPRPPPPPPPIGMGGSSLLQQRPPPPISRIPRLPKAQNATYLHTTDAKVMKGVALVSWVIDVASFVLDVREWRPFIERNRTLIKTMMFTSSKLVQLFGIWTMYMPREVIVDTPWWDRVCQMIESIKNTRAARWLGWWTDLVGVTGVVCCCFAGTVCVWFVAKKCVPQDMIRDIQNIKALFASPSPSQLDRPPVPALLHRPLQNHTVNHTVVKEEERENREEAVVPIAIRVPVLPAVVADENKGVLRRVSNKRTTKHNVVKRKRQDDSDSESDKKKDTKTKSKSKGAQHPQSSKRRRN